MIGIGQLFHKIRTLSRRVWLSVYRRIVPPYRTVVIEEALPEGSSGGGFSTWSRKTATANRRRCYARAVAAGSCT